MDIMPFVPGSGNDVQNVGAFAAKGIRAFSGASVFPCGIQARCSSTRFESFSILRVPNLACPAPPDLKAFHDWVSLVHQITPPDLK